MGVRIGHHGDRWIELGAWHCVTGEPLRFCDDTGALLFLRECVAPGDLRTLRALLTREQTMTGRLDDAGVLRLVAHRLCARTLKATAWHERRHSFLERPRLWHSERIELPAAEPRVATPVEAPSLPAPIVSPPDPDWDAVSQALTLRNAARDGAPFCEICQRQAAPAKSLPPEPAILPANSDPKAQAETLRAAARSGAPFCELCEKQG